MLKHPQFCPTPPSLQLPVFYQQNSGAKDAAVVWLLPPSSLPAPDFIIGIPIAAHHRRRMGKSAFARERTSSKASGLPFLLLSIEPFSGVPLLSFSLSPKVLFFLQQRSRMRRRWRMGNKGSFCEQDAPSSLSPKGRPPSP